MNKTLISFITIIVLSIAAYFIMMEVAGWTQKKAAIIAFGAGAAMILVDVIGMSLKRNRQ